VELKLTLSAKLLAKPLRAALVEPFLKVHNKRAPAAVEWDQIACIKVGGVPLPVDDLEAEVTAATALTPEALKQKNRYRETISVDLLTAVPSPLLSGFVAVAREPPQAHDDPPMVTEELLNIGEAAAKSDEADADMSRRCSNAFQKIADGAEAVSVSAVRAAFLEDVYVRSLCFPEASAHVAALDGAVRRMATNWRVPSVELGEFSAFFSALSAASCAVSAAGIEPIVHEATAGVHRTGNNFLDELLNDEGVSARRIA